MRSNAKVLGLKGDPGVKGVPGGKGKGTKGNRLQETGQPGKTGQTWETGQPWETRPAHSGAKLYAVLLIAKILKLGFQKNIISP